MTAGVNEYIQLNNLFIHIGSGLISLPAKIAIGYYFETKRALATGISECGSGVGIFVFPPFTTFLLKTYGWKITFLVGGGLYLSCATFGALMRPLEVQKEHIHGEKVS